MLKDLYEAKHQFSINKREGAGIKYFKDSEAFIEYSNDMDNIHKDNEGTMETKMILIVFDDVISDILSNKKLNPIITELFTRGENLIFLLFLSHNLIVLYQKH